MRGILESDDYSEQCKTFGVTIKRLDEVLQIATWAISRDAEAHELVEGTPLRVRFIEPYPGVPRLRIFFRIVDDNNVEMMGIERIEEDPSDPVN